MVMGSRARRSTEASTVWALYPFLHDLEVLGIDIACPFNPARAVADSAWITVGAPWIVAWHSIVPVLGLENVTVVFCFLRSVRHMLAVQC